MRARQANPSWRVRNLYNPNVLNSKWHILPALVAIITTTGCLIVTALSVARERRRVPSISCWSPPSPRAGSWRARRCPASWWRWGRMHIALAARFVFHLPFAGSLSLLVAGMVCYGLALAGIGLFISSFCSTQQQAFLGVFSFTVPAVILSATSRRWRTCRRCSSGWQPSTPLTHFIVLLKGSSSKVRLVGRLALLWPLLAIAGVAPTAGARHVPPPYRLTRRLDQLMPVSPSARPAFSDISFHSPAVGKPGFPSTIPHPG